MTSWPAWAPHLPPDVEPADVDLLHPGSLPLAWRTRWRTEPRRAALRFGDEWLTRGDLDDRSAAVAGRLWRAGLRPGDRILLSGASSPSFVVSYCAAIRAGCIVVPVNAAFSKRELEVIVADAEPRAALVDDERMWDWLTEIDGALVVSTPDVPLADGPEPALDQAGPDDPALLPYTSGTTGVPKGALLTHGNLLASANAVRLAWRWTDDDTLILASRCSICTDSASACMGPCSRAARRS